MDDFLGILPLKSAPIQEFLSNVAEAAVERAPFQEFLSNAGEAAEAFWAAFLQVWRTLLASLAVVVLFCRLVGTHRALRWPIFWVISSVMAFDLLLYLGVRSLLGFMEWCAFRMRRQRAVLWRNTTYAEWRQSAEALDRAEGRDAWRDEPRADEYDWRHIQTLKNQLAASRRAGDAAGMMRVLHHALKPNVGGIHEEALYRKARAGTKLLLEDFIRELGESVRALAALTAGAPAEALRTRAFLDAHIAYWGRAALVLTGGAICGVYHFGVLRGLLELGMLPRIVHGTSAGAVVAALLCTRTEAELAPVLSGEAELWREMGADGPFHGSTWWKLRQLLAHGRLYDWREFAQHMAFFSRGMTFEEAFAHSGRVLNISCTPLRTRGRRAPPLMLNHELTPDVDIASAVCASSCVPGLIDPVHLLRKMPDGTLRPYHDSDIAGAEAGSQRIQMRDGSFESDVPLQQLAAQFGVKFTIVSQVNPHVVPFYVHPLGRPGRPSSGRERTGGWRGGFLLGALEVSVKEDLRKHLATMQRLQLLVDLFGVDWSHVWLQPLDGSVNIMPSLELQDYTNILSNLQSAGDLSRKIRHMERCTWEAAAMIRTHMLVEQALDAALATSAKAGGGGGGGAWGDVGRDSFSYERWQWMAGGASGGVGGGLGGSPADSRGAGLVAASTTESSDIVDAVNEADAVNGPATATHACRSDDLDEGGTVGRDLAATGGRARRSPARRRPPAGNGSRRAHEADANAGFVPT